jgi:hypothetical protein
MDTQSNSEAPVATVHPSLEQFREAGTAGLIVRNPDNGKIFRAAHYCWEGCVHGVKIYEMGRKRPLKSSPLMSLPEIGEWLAGLEFVRLAS